MQNCTNEIFLHYIIELIRTICSIFCRLSFFGDLTSNQNELRSTSEQNGPKFMSNQIGMVYGMSSSQVMRYIRLTHLLQELLSLVDARKCLCNFIDVA